MIYELLGISKSSVNFGLCIANICVGMGMIFNYYLHDKEDYSELFWGYFLILFAGYFLSKFFI